MNPHEMGSSPKTDGAVGFTQNIPPRDWKSRNPFEETPLIFLSLFSASWISYLEIQFLLHSDSVLLCVGDCWVITEEEGLNFDLNLIIPESSALILYQPYQLKKRKRELKKIERNSCAFYLREYRRIDMPNYSFIFKPT